MAGFPQNHELDLLAWLDALNQRPQIPLTESSIIRWIDGPVRKFFPFKNFLGGYGGLTLGHVTVRRTIYIGYDFEFINQIERDFDLSKRGCFSWWLTNQRPLILDPSNLPAFVSRREVDEIIDFGLGIIAAHGVVDPLAGVGTYFSFSGLERDKKPLASDALEIIAPTLHAMLMASIGIPGSIVDLSALSPRQIEVVKLTVQCLDDKAIARRLGISEHTVGNHFRSIYSRLGINKRSQLLALVR